MNFKYFKDTTFSKGRTGIGASDIPTLALYNKKYGQTPLTLWEERTGRRESWKGNEATKWGHNLEGLILREALRKLGFSDRDITKWFISKETGKNKYISGGDILHSNTESICPHFKKLVAHADLLIASNNAGCQDIIIEAKSSKFFASKRDDDENEGYASDDLSPNGIPTKVYLQVQTQLMCYDIHSAYVALLSDTSSHRLYGEIKSDVKTQEHILALAERFQWHVDNDAPPKPETWDDVIALNPNLDKESKTVVSGEVESKVLEMKERKKKLDAVIKKAEEEKDDIKNAIGLIIGANAYLENAEGESLAKAYLTERETISLKAIKEKLPDIVQKLSEENLINKSSSRMIKF